MKCKLCRQEKKLIRAHVIPESLYRPQIKMSPLPMRIYSNALGKYPKKAPVGAYDSTILCEGCERVFSLWDDYAQKFLLRDYPDDAVIIGNDEKLALKIEDVDYEKLKLFFVSLLWRASVSSHELFARVNTGCYEDKLRNLILAKNPGDPETFSVIIAKFDHPSGKFVLDPIRTKFDHITFNVFYVAGYVIYIKVDKRNSPEVLKSFTLTPGKSLFIILRDFTQSQELRVIQRILLDLDRFQKN